MNRWEHFSDFTVQTLYTAEHNNLLLAARTLNVELMTQSNARIESLAAELERRFAHVPLVYAMAATGGVKP